MARIVVAYLLVRRARVVSFENVGQASL
jgi:hypothetical protein